MDLSLQTGALAWLVSLLANAYRILRDHDIERQKAGFAKAAAEAENHTKSEFLASMSHELRTPLNAIIGFSDVMQQGMFGPLPERYREYSSDIFQCGSHLLELINEILDLSKLQAGKLELSEEVFDLALAARVSMRLAEPLAQKSKVRLIDNIGRDAPWVRADNRRVRQVLINLLSNAVKFTPEGGEIRVSIANARNGMAISVHDTGIGIAPEDLAQVLEPFSQIESRQSRNHAGTGLGLPIAKKLVELHGGKLTLESELGVGTIVTATLPPERVVRGPSRPGRLAASTIPAMAETST